MMTACSLGMFDYYYSYSYVFQVPFYSTTRNRVLTLAQESSGNEISSRYEMTKNAYSILCLFLGGKEIY